MRRILRKEFGIVALATITLVITVMTWASIQSGSLANALPYLNGQRIVSVPSWVDFGTRSSGQKLELALELRNLSEDDVTLLGSFESCSCMVTNDFPLTIPAGASHAMHVEIALPKTEQTRQINHYVIYYTDCKKGQRVTVRFSGVVAPAINSAAAVVSNGGASKG